MIKAFEDDTLFVLDTKNTTYAFKVLKCGLIKHLHYGRRIHLESSDAFMGKPQFIPGNMIAYSKDVTGLSLENFTSELSTSGKGDVGEVSLILEYDDGTVTSDLVFEKALFYSKINPKDSYSLPYAHKADDELVIILKEKVRNVRLELTYSVFYEADVIARRMRIFNNEKQVVIKKAMSLQLDMPESDYDFISFTGAWAREMSFKRQALGGGVKSASYSGFSSNRCNPFFMLAGKNTGEHEGEAFAFNLLYSGNHMESVSPRYEGIRVVAGINPEGFSYRLKKGETFDVPQAVMTYSREGFNGVSSNMHRFVNDHITPENFRGKTRKVLLNSWEASYFKFDESSLLKMAKEAAKLGIELFVLDDGWFGNRNDDKTSLGDWDCNKKKLPHGLKGLANSIKKLGMGFGIWLEPEMVNVESKLYKEHPDWSVCIDGREHSEGRNQRFLDLTRKEIRDYLVEKISGILKDADIEYVKWDMNRVFSDVICGEGAEEFNYRYIVGLYDILGRLTKAFPEVLFEGCASGGNRFDLGVLSFFPQIWCSDNTDAWCRAGIQNSYSYGYPINVLSAHVSGVPNHQTLRKTPLDTRFNVAAFGILGYECNIADLSSEDREKIKEHIRLYKEYRDVFKDGRFYRLKSPCTEAVKYDSDMEYRWLLVSKDKEKAWLMTVHDKAVANSANARVKTLYLDDEKKYRFRSLAGKINVKNFGDLVNTVAPVHIKQDSLLHNMVSKVVKMNYETEDYTLYGDSLNYCGITLRDNYAAVGYNDDVRYYQDYSSRLYIITEIKDEQ